MKRTIALTAAVLAALAVGTAPAWAQEAAGKVDVKADSACGRVTLTATVPGPAGPTYELAVFSGPNSGDADSDSLGQFKVSAGDPQSKTFTLDEDSYDGSGFVSWSTISGPERDFYASGTIAVDTDCNSESTTTTTATATPGPEPERDRHDRDHRHHDGRDHDSGDDDSDDDSDNSSDSDDDNDSSSEGSDVTVNNNIPAPIVSTSDNSNSGAIDIPTGGVATGVGPAK